MQLPIHTNTHNAGQEIRAPHSYRLIVIVFRAPFAMSAQSSNIYKYTIYLSLSTFLHLSFSLCTLCLSHTLFYLHETKLFISINSNDIDKFDNLFTVFVSQSQHLTERPPAQITLTSPLMLSCTRFSPLYAPHNFTPSTRPQTYSHTHTHALAPARPHVCLVSFVSYLHRTLHHAHIQNA